ncbi:MAG: hypothetical protein R3D98_04345 [Candidatus Krumholzibacteriia bacterium]
MRRNVVLWVAAVVVTLGSAVWQRMTGPGCIRRAGRSGGRGRGAAAGSGTIDRPVALRPAALRLAGEALAALAHRRSWQTVVLERDGADLVGERCRG